MPNITACVHVLWEGINLMGVNGLKKFNGNFPQIPITHFVPAAYLSRTTNQDTIAAIVNEMIKGIKKDDEVALHLPCWKSVYDYGNQGLAYTSNGADAIFDCEYAGQQYQDRGYYIELNSLNKADINTLYDWSTEQIAPLLWKLDTQYRGRDYKIKGVRSGAWLASDGVFEVLNKKKGLVYDASAVNWLFARQATPEFKQDYSRLLTLIERLWGPELGENNNTNWHATLGSGVGRVTGPYKIGALIELPNNGMLMPAVKSSAVRDFFKWSLRQPKKRDVYLSIGIIQETTETHMEEFAAVIQDFSGSAHIRWMTHAEYAAELMGAEVSGSSVQGLTKGIGQFG